jgi:F-type H+-transporting ATPase subunit gamma
MPSLKELRNRITSVGATAKITKAMQMVAAAKLRRAQEAAIAARPYAERMGTVLANLNERIGGQEGGPPLLVGTGRDDTHLLIVATAERGLCGGFNSSIARLARVHALRLLDRNKKLKILCIGRKGRDALQRDFGALIMDLVDLKGVRQVGFENAREIGARVRRLFDEGEFDICTVFFSEFKSVLTQTPKALQLIPVQFSEADEGGDDPLPGGDAAYEYEPDEQEILADLLPLNVNTQIFRALLENAASEQGARMTAMDSATRNAGEMIEKLTLHYNRTRQAMITRELIEIVSGAEAL